MMKSTAALAALALLAACGDGQPLFDENGNPTGVTVTQASSGGNGTTTGGTITGGSNGGTTGGNTTDGGIATGGALPPGTVNPTNTAAIFRVEPRDGDGGGLVTQATYNRRNDTFTVDNIGFDGANVYKRDTVVPTVGNARVFAADEVTTDFLTGNAIDQIVPYRALYGVSSTQLDGEPRTSYAIVRTGGYVNKGFGGYIYERNGGVKLPDTGQATFSGKYAGIRVFDGRGGLEYTDGDMRIDIDFEDFNANDAVKGRIINRHAYDEDGIRLQTGSADTDLKLPTILFTVQEGTPSLNADGEIAVPVSSYVPNDTGALEPFETGTFTGIIAGDTTTGAAGSPGRGGEIVGIVKVTSEDPRTDGVTVQETGGAILTR